MGKEDGRCLICRKVPFETDRNLTRTHCKDCKESALYAKSTVGGALAELSQAWHELVAALGRAIEDHPRVAILFVIGLLIIAAAPDDMWLG